MGECIVRVLLLIPVWPAMEGGGVLFAGRSYWVAWLLADWEPWKRLVPEAAPADATAVLAAAAAAAAAAG